MILHEPFKISSRLMPAVEVNGAWISLGLSGRQTPDGRDLYEGWIDLPNGGGEYPIEDLRSGCQGGEVQEGMRALLSFLLAAAESYAYRLRTGRAGENEDLFPPAVVEWANSCSDALGLLLLEIEETEGLVED